MKYNGKIKNSQKRPIIPWNIGFHNKPKYSWWITLTLTSHFSIGIHTSYRHCTSYSEIQYRNCDVLPSVLSPGLEVNWATSTILTANCCPVSLLIHLLTTLKGPLNNTDNKITLSGWQEQNRTCSNLSFGVSEAAETCCKYIPLLSYRMNMTNLLARSYIFTHPAVTIQNHPLCGVNDWTSVQYLLF